MAPSTKLSDADLNDLIWNHQGYEGVTADGEVEANNERLAALRSQYRSMTPAQQERVTVGAEMARASTVGRYPTHYVHVQAISNEFVIVVEDLLGGSWSSKRRFSSRTSARAFAEVVRDALRKGDRPEASAKWSRI
jgi:hypothetical protein